jgi:hypothetical protein
MRAHRIFLGAVLLAAPASAAPVDSRPTTPQPLIQSLRLDPAPLWASSATLSPDARNLLVVDALRSVVDTYDLTDVGKQGRQPALVAELTAHDATLGASFLPSRIQGLGEATFLLQVEDSIYPFTEGDGRRLEARRPQDGGSWPALKVADSAVRPDLAIGGLFRWSASDVGVFAYADLKRAEGGWTSAFVWIPKDHPANFKVVHEVPLESAARHYHLLIEPLIANLGDDFVFLVYDEVPMLYRFRPAEGLARQLGPVPQQYRHLPALPPTLGPGSAAANYRVLEGATMPAGVVGSNGALYLLTREPGANADGTLWKLHLLDENGQTIGVRKLPTRASHLTVAPGSKFWVMVERGTVGEDLRQDNSTALLVSAEWLSENLTGR